MQKVIDNFNSCGLRVDCIRTTEQPPIKYLAHYRGSSRYFDDGAALVEWVRWPEAVRYGQTLRAWLDNTPTE